MLVTNEGTIKLTDFGLSKLDVERSKSKFKVLLKHNFKHTFFVIVYKARFPLGEFVRATRSENKNPAT